MKRRMGDPATVGCTYCAAEPGERCVLTLAPDLPTLSIEWAHRARVEEVSYA